jgi:putative oxidoreductase
MSIFEASPWASRMLSVFRIVAGLVFVSEGTTKLFNYPPSEHVFPLMSLLGLAGILEFFGGLAIALGLLTKPVAFILAGEMAVAYFQVHFPKSVFPTVNGGMPALLYCFFYLYLMFAGAGEWSIDAIISAKAKNSTRKNKSSVKSVAFLALS